MSVLASLVDAYERLETRDEVPPYGFSSEKIGFLIPLREDGTPCPPIDLRVGEGKKRQAPTMRVPQPSKRTSGVAPTTFWDKTSYALGVTAGEGRRTAEEHAAFRGRHLALFAETDDAGLLALRRFLEAWRPEDFARLGWPEEMKDQNVVFALESERIGPKSTTICVHDRPAAKALWARIATEGEKTFSACLVTGEHGPVARLHPAIKGVWGAQSSGASLVSFNLDAFTSYGHEQGDNAPVSEAAAFAYTSALNRFLERDSGHRIQIGDASTVFWADARDAEAATEAEDLFAEMLGETRIDEKTEAKKVGAILKALRAGRPLADIRPALPEGVRFHVLGLAPNAARLSVRFYLEDDFGVIGSRWLAHLERMRIEPPPKDPLPSMWRLLIETAALRKSENIAPNLAGEWLRAILSGTHYPLTLMSSLITRMRADHDVDAHRVGILKSVLLENFGKEVPVALDINERDSGYLLGRLFAAYEYAQTQALPSLNATIRDKYYGTASASPRAVFPLLQRSATHHLAKLRKEKPGLATVLDRRIGEIFDVADPRALFVPTLNAARQSMFAVGYYHQKNDFYRPRSDASAAPAAQETL
ncbi:type I-C CRISPR-associated protein Cas8c/Csd1 [Pinisolibacter aquiterrae]|uniref:type I-C CRISPR-associated protein Cas8c/Csd1 n=1 Tax=Pinisolibacter aquiterrae TaxID=2815579 RepID=UPI001C3C81E8|nr:type I-C CRISPR-associated protein Cas8c/Csd1 [Pinisolibacter aquiterrae]MBV5263910.1 type I-C CRISPR-associated protein Cas8c/Csd1 [Pinisolibacter aquiterrae]MCC8235921.1 type I-C CRISPR-associated protein Cas8c/Csd1 [Pinisolibacter aquiterrae]